MEVVVICSRYNFTAEEAAEIKKMIQEISDRLYGTPIKTGEIYPTNFVPVLLAGKEKLEPVGMTWGFLHFKNSGVIINARSETVIDKRMFQKSVLTRRCVVPSTGFFEWSRNGSEKIKYLFRRPGEKILYMAGCWNTFKDKDGSEKQRFVILTTQANNSMKEDLGELSLFPSDDAPYIYNRMTVILRPEEQGEWLSDGVDFDKLFNRTNIELLHVPA